MKNRNMVVLDSFHFCRGSGVGEVGVEASSSPPDTETADGCDSGWDCGWDGGRESDSERPVSPTSRCCRTGGCLDPAAGVGSRAAVIVDGWCLLLFVEGEVEGKVCLPSLFFVDRKLNGLARNQDVLPLTTSGPREYI